MTVLVLSRSSTSHKCERVSYCFLYKKEDLSFVQYAYTVGQGELFEQFSLTVSVFLVTPHGNAFSDTPHGSAFYVGLQRYDLLHEIVEAGRK